MNTIWAIDHRNADAVTNIRIPSTPAPAIMKSGIMKPMVAATPTTNPKNRVPRAKSSKIIRLLVVFVVVGIVST